MALHHYRSWVCWPDKSKVPWRVLRDNFHTSHIKMTQEEESLKTTKGVICILCTQSRSLSGSPKSLINKSIVFPFLLLLHVSLVLLSKSLKWKSIPIHWMSGLMWLISFCKICQEGTQEPNHYFSTNSDLLRWVLLATKINSQWVTKFSVWSLFPYCNQVKVK